MGVKFKIFQHVVVHPRRVMARFDAGGLAAMRKVGAVLMRRAQGKIKRRIVTNAMRGRLQSAFDSKDKTRIRRILDTIKRRQEVVSQPGQPPIAHVPDTPYGSLRDIRFHVDNRSVIVGPVKGNMVTYTGGGNRKTVPELLEFGGTASIIEKQTVFPSGLRSNWRRADQRRSGRPNEKFRRRQARYAPRPFMAPTLKESTSRIREIIRTTMRKALP